MKKNRTKMKEAIQYFSIDPWEDEDYIDNNITNGNSISSNNVLYRMHMLQNEITKTEKENKQLLNKCDEYKQTIKMLEYEYQKN